MDYKLIYRFWVCWDVTGNKIKDVDGTDIEDPSVVHSCVG